MMQTTGKVTQGVVASGVPSSLLHQQKNVLVGDLNRLQVQRRSSCGRKAAVTVNIARKSKTQLSAVAGKEKSASVEAIPAAKLPLGHVPTKVLSEPLPVPLDDFEKLLVTIKQVSDAQKIYSTFTQEQVDAIFLSAASAANAARIPLAKLAVEESGMGVIEDKVIKNHFASEFIYNRYRHEKTCGVIEDDRNTGVAKVAEPIGVIAGVVPCTNPTSTTIFKALISLKTRNGIIFSPHPRSNKSTVAAAKVVLDAAVAAGAPPGIIGWIDTPTLPLSQALMKSPDVKLILATGGPAMVRAAYSSGHPSIGVGAGNTPALIDETAHIKMAVSSILLSKTFDNGVICASEQSVIVQDSVYDACKKEFQARGAYFLNEEERKIVGSKIIVDGRLNADIVGQSVQSLSKVFGLTFPPNAKVLIGEVDIIGKEEPFAYEKLCPILGMYRAPTFERGVSMAQELIEFGGPGHTSVLYTHRDNNANVELYRRKLNTVRILVNTPASQGAIGDMYNFHGLDPSLTLGCGSWGSTSVSSNVGTHQLLNVKTVTSRRENMLWFRVPPKIYFKGGSLDTALRELSGKKRAFIVTDRGVFKMGTTDRVTDVLDEISVHHQCFYDVDPDPDLATVRRGLEQMLSFQPDVIIAIGGGSPMDAAKVMWLMYEHPEIKFEGLAMRFMDIRKRVYEVPTVGNKALFIAVPTTSGTGSEVTPFSVVTDETTKIKYPLADYALTPNVAIVDPQLVQYMPPKLTAYGGLDAVTHAVESFVSCYSTEYTKGLSLEAVRLLFMYLPRAYTKGGDDYKAREKVHYAATIAGMAFGNAFLGICHSMAHKVGSAFHVPHGLANAALLGHVIRYNATDAPFKQAIFPQYTYPFAKSYYSRIASTLSLGGETDDVQVERLITAFEILKKQCDVPGTLKEIIGADREAEWFAALDNMAEQAFDDQCTGANPRYPLIADLKAILEVAWDTPAAPDVWK